jgi:predicted DNA-binding transcriptional regulator YafY
MPRGNQLARQWQLIQLIQSPAGIAVDDAARKLGCTVRTIWRDLQVLERAGFPLYGDKAADGPRSIWKVQEDFKAGLPIKLTLAETAALLMSRDLLRPAGPPILGAAITSAFDKIGRALSRDARQLLDQMRESIGVRAVGAKLQAPAAEHVALIQRAMLERRRLDMRYYSMSRDEENRRQVDPYHLTIYDGGYYMVGYCLWRETERIFAVERIRDLKMLTTRFEVRSGFDSDEYLKHTWGIVKGEIVPVKVIFARSVARYVRDRLWHPSQKFRELPNGRLEMSLRVADTLELRRWILGYGPEAEVTEPAAIRETLAKEAAGVMQKALLRRPPLAAVSQRRARNSASGSAI